MRTIICPNQNVKAHLRAKALVRGANNELSFGRSAFFFFLFLNYLEFGCLCYDLP